MYYNIINKYIVNSLKNCRLRNYDKKNKEYTKWYEE